MAANVLADGPGPGAAAGGQEKPEEAQGESKLRRGPETTAQHVCEGELSVVAAQSLVYTISFVYRPNTSHITRPDLHGCCCFFFFF